MGLILQLRICFASDSFSRVILRGGAMEVAAWSGSFLVWEKELSALKARLALAFLRKELKATAGAFLDGLSLGIAKEPSIRANPKDAETQKPLDAAPSCKEPTALRLDLRPAAVCGGCARSRYRR